jgi:hypothetical protein
LISASGTQIGYAECLARRQSRTVTFEATKIQVAREDITVENGSTLNRLKLAYPKFPYLFFNDVHVYQALGRTWSQYWPIKNPQV